jgi:hypothetical protein
MDVDVTPSAGDRDLPGRVGDAQRPLRAAEQHTHQHERLLLALRRAGVEASGVSGELRQTPVLDLDDVESLSGSGHGNRWCVLLRDEASR